MARLTQDNLGAHRVNLTRDNPRALEVRHIHIRVNLLDNQGNLTFNKANPVSSKGTHLDKLGQFIILKINQQSSKDILLGRGGNPTYIRANLLPSLVIFLGRVGNPMFNRVNPLLNP